ncbi:MAG: 2-C-methyl-D-erythritol 2,4-cyclodiphosphate synthase, partial [Thermodesulfobacteriota bacterium]
LEIVPDKTDLVLVHDGVRPLVTPELIELCVARASDVGAAMAAVPVTDTLKAEDNGRVKYTVDRRGLWQAQTPQVAETALLKKAFARAAAEGFQGTDEASLLERIGVEVSIVPGSERNIKVTRVEDLQLAGAIYSDMHGGGKAMGVFRVGHGFDAHRLVEGRPLVLGGEVIPFDLGLLGHSDADVLVHALCDAILGAAGLGDIGRHFPDKDPAYKDVSSILLLGEVAEKITDQGFRLVNADITVIAQRPKLAPYFPAMLDNLGKALEVDRSCLNLKATTTEQLGFTGRGEGMGAHAVVSLVGTLQEPLTDR